MFTGIVEAVGTVVAVEPLAELLRLVVEAPALAAEARVGDSIAVHWGLPVLRLAPDQLDRLETYTRQSLELAFA